MEARNRKINDWYDKIRRGEIKLPRFQRFEAWDRHRIASLAETVIHNLPLGITLVLDVGDNEKFISRYLQTAPETDVRVHEHLLDGQQRLTALWRVLHNNYDSETYYIYLDEFDNFEGDEDREDMTIYFRVRWKSKKTGDRRPLWCDVPKGCLRRGLIPTQLLRPDDIQDEIDSWIEEATASLEPVDGTKEQLKTFYDYQKRISDRIKDLRSVITNYNLPYLALPAHTDKSVALDVFINMNTNSKPLSQYDIIVAEVESVMGQSLHDLEEELEQRHPEVSRYSQMSDLILTTSALLQGHLPNQRGAWDMDKQKMVDNWAVLERSLSQMASFLQNEGIFDSERLPTNAVLAPIAAIYAEIPDSGDKRGKDELLLKKYLWYAFFTDRYENAAATHANSDFNALKKIVTGATKEDGTTFEESDVPIFSEYRLAEVDQIANGEWPKRKTILGRGVFAVLCRLGALDFATGQRLDSINISERHYHHVYPDALLKEAGIESFLALNCALIADKTNLSIGRKDPVKYLAERYEWTSQAIVEERLHSHLIPVPELANGGYEGMPDDDKVNKIQDDFSVFIQKRAELVSQALEKLTEGRQLSTRDLFVG